MRLLIVKLSALGDVIQALAALGRVRPLAPGLVVDWAVDARFAPLLAGHPSLDRLHVLDLKGWWRRGEWGKAWAAVRQLRAERYDVVADLQGLLKSRLLARLAEAGRRVVYSRRDDLTPWRKGGPDALRAAPPPHEASLRGGPEAPTLRRPPQGGHPTEDHPEELRSSGAPVLASWGPRAGVRRPPPSHVVDLYVALLAAVLDVRLPEGPVPEPAPPLFPVGAADAAALDGWLASAGVGAGEPLALVVPGGGWPTKLLPVPSLVAAVAPLAARGLRPLVLWGSEEERRLAEAAAAGLADDGRGPAPVVVPRLPLPKLAALCARIAVAVGGDTGPIHLAAAQGAATASFFGPTVAARSAPRGAAHRTVQAVVPCGPCFGRRCRAGEFICMPGLDAAAIAGAATAALGHRGHGAVAG